MWRNYLTVGVRALAKSKTYAFINIFGLAIGMAACLMILLYVRYEMSYDRWIPDAERVYQVQSWYKSSETGQEAQLQMTPYIAGKSLRGDFPQIEQEVYVSDNDPVFFRNGQATSTEDYLWVDGNFLDVVPLPLVRGDADALGPGQFGRPHPVRGAAALRHRRRRRPDADPDHPRRRPRLPDHRHPARSAAQLALPDQQPDPDRLRRLQFGRAAGARMLGLPERLGLYQAAPGRRREPDPRRPPGLGGPRDIPDENAGEARFNAGDDQDWHIVNLQDVHLGRAQAGAMAPGNDRTTIVTFAIVALLILGMAVVNFTNLATARASQRAREVALQEGARREPPAADRPVHRRIDHRRGGGDADRARSGRAADAVARRLPRGRSQRLLFRRRRDRCCRCCCWSWSVGILGGLYPAFFLSRFEPATVLKANKSSSETPGTGRMRNVLVSPSSRCRSASSSAPR